MMNRAAFALPFLLGAAFLAPASAIAGFQLINDSSVVGNGSLATDGYNITRDTDTNLEWLDVTLSQNYSFDYVSSQFGAGGRFEGFRYATLAEVYTFWTNGGITNHLAANNTDASDEDIEIDPMISLWGETGGSFLSPSRETHALTADLSSSSQRIVARLLVYLPPEITGLYRAESYEGSLTDAESSSTLASALVRAYGSNNQTEPLPEPASVGLWGLFCLGAGLVGMRRRNDVQKG